MTKCICMASALAIVGIAASILMLVRQPLHPPSAAPCLLGHAWRTVFAAPGFYTLRWRQARAL